MQSGSTSKLIRALALGLAFLLLVAAAAPYFLWNAGQPDGMILASRTLTAVAEETITATLAAEVGTTIARFESRWMSPDAHQAPSVQTELATGRFLEYWGYARWGPSIENEPFWLITRSAAVKRLRVLEYSPSRFKAVAWVILTIDKVTPAGKFIEVMPTYERCRVYVFLRDGEAWKLAASFDMTDDRTVDRDWEDAQDWSKQLIGELPRHGCDQ